MSEKKVEKPANAKPFMMPKPRHKGQQVVWYPLGDVRADPCIAFVQVIDGASLDLAVLMPTNSTFTNLYAVRHVDDKACSLEERRNYGGWDFIEGKEVSYQTIMATVQAVMDRWDQLFKKLDERVQMIELFDGKPKAKKG